MDELLNHWKMNERTNEWTNEPTNKRKNERSNKQTNEFLRLTFKVMIKRWKNIIIVKGG